MKRRNYLTIVLGTRSWKTNQPKLSEIYDIIFLNKALTYNHSFKQDTVMAANWKRGIVTTKA